MQSRRQRNRTSQKPTKRGSYCTECGGSLTWDRKLRMHCCVSCGMTFTESQLARARDRLYERPDDEEEEKRRRHNEYLDWWFKDKKERRD